MNTLVIKKWLNGKFEQVRTFDQEMVEQLRPRTDGGMDVLFKGSISTFDDQCVAEFRSERDSFLLYAEVQIRGNYNTITESEKVMFATGLSADEYCYIQDNFAELKDRYSIDYRSLEEDYLRELKNNK